MANPTPAIRLNPNEGRTVPVNSRIPWNHTSIAVQTGEVYELAAAADSVWNDASTRVSAAGYESARLALFRFLRRRRDAPWFELIGGVDESENRTFRIGVGTTVTLQDTGELVLYANDVRFMYWNNSGTIDVTVRRVR
jgi:hypothetical protein